MKFTAENEETHKWFNRFIFGSSESFLTSVLSLEFCGNVLVFGDVEEEVLICPRVYSSTLGAALIPNISYSSCCP